MLKLMRRIRDDDEGFTLIELMVVVLIIAILIAIAIPTFLGARERAQDRAAQSDLRNALTAAKTLYVDDQTYASVDAAALGGVEPSLEFADSGSSTVANPVILVDATAETITLTKMSQSGTCFVLIDRALPVGNEPAGTVGPTSDGANCGGGGGD